MHNNDLIYFNKLKQEVVNTFRKTYPGASSQISDWRGRTIVQFQDELLIKVNENISEKWFYNHMKGEAVKLPRIDMLNILSRYCGYADWQDFVFKSHKEKEKIKTPDRSARVFLYVSLLTLTLLTTFYIVYQFASNREYKFCVVNGENMQPVRSKSLSVELLEGGKKKSIFLLDSNSCFNFKTREIDIKLVLQAPFFKSDTIHKQLRKFEREEKVKIYPDDYALMLKYYANSNVDDWENRKNQLDKLFDDNAMIYEVINIGGPGIELYDKSEFISKLTIPSSNLKKMNIIDISYRNDKIIKLKFSID